jgi:putative ABC transport system permease protein
MGIQLRAGRQFAATDGKEAPRVAIINETIAKQFFPNEDPIGRRLSVGRPAPTIVGVVGDTRNSGLDQRVSYEVYLPILQQPEGNMLMSTLAVRIASDQNNPAGIASPSALAGLTAAIRDQVRAIDPNETVFPVIKMDERLSNAVAERRFQTLLLSFFSGIALVIATVVTLGLAAAFALTRVLKNLLFEVSATDPGTFALIALLIVGVALIASYIPARRATKVDPLQALRHE